MFQCGVEYGASVNCTGRGCNGRGNNEILDPETEECFCGVYQFSERYFNQCYDPPTWDVELPNPMATPTLEKCAGNVNCATQCVRNYIEVSENK